VPVEDIPVDPSAAVGGVSVLDVLSHFKLCCATDEMRSAFLFPTLLRETMPASAWRRDEAFTVHVGARFVCSEYTQAIPPGLFPRLQVALRNTLDGAACKLWRDGVDIDCGTAQACVRLSAENGISVHVRGTAENRKSCRELLRLIAGQIANVSELN